MIAPVVVLGAMGPVHTTHRDNSPTHGSSIPARSHIFVEIDNEKISTVVLLSSAVSFKKGSSKILY